jgi:hypothetical protein
VAHTYGQIQDDTIEILDVIAQKIVISGLGNNDCDECDSIKLSSAVNFFAAIRDAGFVIVRESKLSEDAHG